MPDVMPEAVDLGRFYRIVNVNAGRVSGKFQVMASPRHENEYLVTAIDATVYNDDHRTFGRVFYSNDLRGEVRDGKVEIQDHCTPRDKFHDMDDARAEIEAAMLLASDVARFDA